jgi:hypothetical protein
MNGERRARRLMYQTYGAVSMPINIALLLLSGLLVNGACPSHVSRCDVSYPSRSLSQASISP